MIEYKVGGPVVPNSGVFTVRVTRPLGGQPDLGLTVNEDLVITEVRRGSLAYRTGSLASGDRLLAIDGEQLDSGDLRQAAQLLHRPGSSVVALTVRKSDLNPKETRYLIICRTFYKNIEFSNINMCPENKISFLLMFSAKVNLQKN